MSESQIIARFKQLRAEQQQIQQKIGELEIELNEHHLVIVAIEKLEPVRRCYRLVGGVLVERTVGDVLPAVKKNKDGIADVIQQLRDQLHKRSEELNDFIVKNKIQIKGGSEEESTKETKSSTTGVLV